MQLLHLQLQVLNSTQTGEAYAYDALHRLTEATRTGASTATVTYAYDAAGNFTSKSDFSTTAASAYTYTGGSCGGGPNAVKSVALKAGGTRTYCYDATGNLTADNAGLAVRYDHTQRPLKITRSSVTQTFDYAPDGMRFRQSGSDGEVAYFGGLERRYSPAANDKTYIGGSVVVTTTATTRRVDYLLTDRLGSVDALANSSGALLETRGFDAFGKPRNGVWADTTPPRLATTGNTPHGFTGHEHLNSLELIHMNGRVYDYHLGRFMGVDPFIQFPLNSQSLNPYSYILNNPLSGTDPTGYMFDDGCKRRQSCQMQLNTLNMLQAQISNMAGSMGAGASSSRVNAMHAARNGAQGQGATGADSRQDQAATAANKGSRSGPNLWGGAGCGTRGPNECRSATTYPARENDPIATEAIPDVGALLKAIAHRQSVIANEGIQAIPILGVEIFADSAQNVYNEYRSTGDVSIETASSLAIAAAARGMLGMRSAGVGVNPARAAGPPIVIGENMTRVNSYARTIGGQTIDDWLGGRQWSQQLNDEFVGTMKAQGRQFIDIGPDFGRRLRNRVDPTLGRPPSSVYGGERQELLNYGNYQRIYDRSGKYQGGVTGFDP